MLPTQGSYRCRCGESLKSEKVILGGLTSPLLDVALYNAYYALLSDTIVIGWNLWHLEPRIFLQRQHQHRFVLQPAVRLQNCLCFPRKQEVPLL